MTSLLRQIVAGPRAQHADTGLDLCYVTPHIIATSGPSQTYPKRAYRNPLDRLVAFLDATHGDGWAIWEFRAEGTGYPDDAVHGRIRHYPFPDHHPPPFRLIPAIVASMRDWLHGGPLEGRAEAKTAETRQEENKEGRVVVVHCKAGKGRSGTLACSYLVSECGWAAEDALARFTDRRMRPRFGAGVSIPSQLRWVSYVDRWTRGGKPPFADRPVEITEVRVWGLRHGVCVSVDGFADEGKRIQTYHAFSEDERIVVDGQPPPEKGGLFDLVADLAGYGDADEPDYGEIAGKNGKPEDQGIPSRSRSKRASRFLRGMASPKAHATSNGNSRSRSSSSSSSRSATQADPAPARRHSSETSSQQATNSGPDSAEPVEPGGQAVIFRPKNPIRVPTSDVNVSLERHNRAASGLGLTMVTSVAHAWFNAFFEGGGAERAAAAADGDAEPSGVFEIDWDRMDGIKGSRRKGTRACDRLAVVWRFASPAAAPAIVVEEPPEGASVPQMRPADWTGREKDGLKSGQEGLGLRAERSSSDAASGSTSESGHGKEHGGALKGVKISGPLGEETLRTAG